jgi:glycosyltransferase involved in cell wall biosynthesis
MARLVSVIVPTKQRPDLLRDALSSIRAIEGPDLQFEILVGDNGQLQATRTVAEEFGCLYFSTKRDGAAAARNLGLAKASGEFVAFLDDDDVWTRDTIRPHIAIMDTDTGVAAAFGQIVYVTQELEPVSQPWPETGPSADRLFVAMLSGYFPQIGATVVRANVARAVGLMNEDLLFAQDWDWQLRIARAHRIAFVNQTCVLSRVRALGSFDDTQMARTKYIARIFRRHALPEFRRWATPRSFLRAYVAVNTHIYDYFIRTAVDRANEGNKRGARQAIYRAFRINPVRATKMLKNYADFSDAIRTSFGLRRSTQKS